MDKIYNKTIDKFIVEFENRFRNYLQPTINVKGLDNKKPPQYTANFVVFEGKEKYSDWDIHCRADSRITLEVLKSMDEMIRSFQNFSHPGLILTPFPEHSLIKYHYIGTKTVLHFMAYLNKENHAPFIDIHVEYVPNNLLQEAYSVISGQDFINWIILTYWRKYLNNINDEALPGLMEYFILPHFLEKREVIITNPLKFFKEYLSRQGYVRALNFLLNRGPLVRSFYIIFDKLNYVRGGSK